MILSQPQKEAVPHFDGSSPNEPERKGQHYLGWHCNDDALLVLKTCIDLNGNGYVYQ